MFKTNIDLQQVDNGYIVKAQIRDASSNELVWENKSVSIDSDAAIVLMQDCFDKAANFKKEETL